MAAKPQTIDQAYAQIKEQYPNATLSQMDNGSYHIQSSGQFELYLPANFSSLNSAFYYYNGADGGGGGEKELVKAMKESVENDNADKIVCINSRYDDHSTNVLNIVGGGSGYNHYYGMGFSMGADDALKSVADRVQTNPNLPPQIICSLESAYDGSQLDDIGQSRIDALIKNDATLVMFEANAGAASNSSSAAATNKALAKQGLNIVIIENKYTDAGDHVNVPTELFQENVIGYLAGDNSKLETLTEKYTYKMFNPSTGEFEVVSAETALNSMGRTGDDEVKFDPVATQEAINLTKKASTAVDLTPSNIANADAIASGIDGLDISNWQSQIPEANKQIEAIHNMPSILEQIFLEMQPLDSLLNEFLATFNGDVSTIPGYVKSLMSAGKLNSGDVSTFLTGLLTKGVLNTKNLKDVVPQMVVNNTLSPSEFVDFSVQCSQVLAMQGVNQNGKTNYYESGYYHDLKITSDPVGEMKNTLTELMMKNGISQSEAQNFSNNYISKVNSSLGEMVVNNGLTYTGAGVATVAFAMTGIFSSFGYMLDYELGGNYESNGKNGLMLGNEKKNLNALDCSSLYDYLCRCVGINGSGHAAKNKAMYAVTIDEKIAAGTEDHGYWLKQMANDGRIEYYYDDIETGTVNQDFMSGNPGDILVCKSGTHMQVIVGKDDNGYYVAEETWISTDEEDHGLRIQYYNFDQFTHLKNANPDSYPYIVHMDNYYDNTTAVSKENGYITYGYNGGQIRTDISYGNNTGDYGHYNNYIPPEVYQKELGLSYETTELMKAQFNNSNKNTHIMEYNVSQEMQQKADEMYAQKGTGVMTPSPNTNPSLDLNVPTNNNKENVTAPEYVVPDQRPTTPEYVVPDQKPTTPEYVVPEQKPTTPEYVVPEQKPTTPEYVVPEQKPTTPEYVVPEQKPTTPEYVVPEQKPTTPEYVVPEQRPTTPEYVVPEQRPTTPEYVVPEQRPTTPEYVVPEQRPTTPEYVVPEQRPTTPEYVVPEQRPTTPEYVVPEQDNDLALGDESDNNFDDSSNNIIDNDNVIIDISKPNDNNSEKDNIIVDANNSMNNTKKANNAGVLLGGVALAGAAIAGKYAYDKIQENKEDENVEDRYYEDFDISKDRERYINENNVERENEV